MAASCGWEASIGTISPGKRTNLTILSESPLDVDQEYLRDISVWGTVMEGRVLPLADGQKKASLDRPGGAASSNDVAVAEAAIGHAFRVAHGPE